MIRRHRRNVKSSHKRAQRKQRKRRLLLEPLENRLLLIGPGGVEPDLGFWLKADAGTSSTTDGANFATWTDQSPNAHAVIAANATREPTFQTDVLNFNPAVHFDGSDGLDVASTLGLGGTSDFTVFAVADNEPGAFNADTLLGPQLANGRNRGGLQYRTGGGGAYELLSRAHVGGFSLLTTPDAPYEPALTSFSRGGNDFTSYVSGALDTATTSNYSFNFHNMSVGYSHPPFNQGEFFQGDIAELIVFNRDLTATEKGQVNSYLSVKYGISPAVGEDIVDSSNATRWDAAANSVYHNDVTGIGRDDAAGLEQQVSMNISSDALVTMDNGGAFGADQSFLIWGNDNSSTTFATDVTGTALDRMSRIWTVEEAGTVGTVTVRVPQSAFRGTQPTLIRSVDTTFDNTDTLVSLTDDGNGNFAGTIDFGDGEFFTLAQFPPPAPGGVPLNLEFWVKADAGTGTTTDGATVSTWADQSGAGNDATVVGATTPAYENDPADQFNFNPVVRLQATDRFSLANQNFDYANTTLFAAASPDSTGFRTLYAGGSTRSPLLIRAGTNNVSYFQGISRDSGVDWAAGERALLSNVMDASTATFSKNGGPDGVVAGISTATGQYDVLGNGIGINQAMGDIAETAIYDTNSLTTQEISRIESYFAVKYGLTLGDTTTTIDYLDSEANTIWSGDATYQNDIAGIGQDDASGLLQLKSRSVNSDAVVTIEAAGANVVNGEFLLWGNDDGSTSLSDEISGSTLTRMGRIWTVQETGQTGDLTITLPQTSLVGMQPTLFVSADTTIDNSDTQIALTDDGNGNYEATVNLEDGQFFTFAHLLPVSPGAVQLNLTLWLRADAGVTYSGSSVSAWADQSVIGNDATQATASKQPVIVENGLNFNPTVNYDGANDEMETGANPFLDTDDFTFFAVQIGSSITRGEGNTIGNGWSFATSSGASTGVAVTAPLSPENAGSPFTLAADTPYLLTNVWDAGTSLSGFANGLAGTPDNIVGATLRPSTRNLVLGKSNTAFGQTNIGDVIAYDRVLTTTEQQQVESYLAVKYGISLGDTSTPVNYLDSAGSTTWNGSATYQNDVAGIGRDDDTALDQRTSMSVNSDALITIAGGGPFSADKTFLMWGNDDGSTALSDSISGSSLTRMGRIWRVQETGQTGDVTLTVPQSAIGGSQQTLFVSADSTFDNTDTQIPLTDDGNGNFLATVNLEDGQFFSFAGLLSGPGGVTTNIALWLKANDGTDTTTDDATVNTWTDQSGTGNDAALVAGTTPSYHDDAAKLFNFNPVIEFANSDRFALANQSLTFETSTLFAAGAPGANANNVLFRNSTVLADDVALISDPSGNVGYFEQNANAVRDSGLDWANDERALFSAVLETTTATYSKNGGPDAAAVGALDTTAMDYDHVGGSNTIANQAFGDVAETAVYDTSALTATEISRIESYFAVKYGLTLGDTTNTVDYLDSGANTIWTGSATYQNEVAGVGRDDLSALLQLMSRSVNSDSIVTMAAIEAELDDSEFLLWGNDDGSTSVSVEVPGASLARMQRIWTVSETGQTGDLSVVIPQSALGAALPTMLVSSDATFDNSDTQITLADDGNGNYAGIVNLEDGQFFTFAQGIVPAPGGVTLDIGLWLKANVGITQAGGLVTQWDGQSASGTIASQGTATEQPTFVDNAINFNPLVRFDGTDDELTLPDTNLPSGTSQRSFFSVSTTNEPANALDGNIFYYGSGSNGTSWRVIANDNRYGLNSSNDVNVANGLSIGGVPTVGSVRHGESETGNQIEIAVDGVNQTVTDVFQAGTFAINTATSGTARVGQDLQTTDFFDGDIPELFMYGREVTDNERDRIESYLAVKYGITLGAASPVDYLDTASNVIWDATANSTYHNDVAGIGRDDDEVLVQPVSKSVNADALLTIGIADPFSADQSYLMWGNDDGATTFTTAAGTYTRMDRIWKVQESGTVGEVEVAIPGISSAGVLLVDDDGDFSSGATAYDLVGSNNVAGNVDFTDGQFFTFALPTTDYGDAPDMAPGTGTGNYNTRSIDNGPTHTIVAGLQLGASVDAEVEAAQSPSANGDDLDGTDDEDGVVNPGTDLTAEVSTQPTIDVRATNTTGSAATLYGWIDYNQNGLFDNATERTSVPVPDGSNNVIFTLTFPAAPSVVGNTFARFRLSTTAAAADATGAASDGEVEDYPFSVVDTTAPTLTSFTRQNPTAATTNADTLVFLATFNEDVQNVDATDFAVNSTSTASVTGINPLTASTYEITVSGGNLAGFDGTVGINLAGTQDIQDLASNALPNGEPATDEIFTLDNTAPILTSFTRKTPATTPTNADTLVFLATFNEDVTVVDIADFVINSTSSASVTNVAMVTASTWDVTVSGGDLVGFTGTVGIDLAGAQNITDLVGNALPAGEPSTDDIYTLDNTAPTLTSFTRKNPATTPTNADTLVFLATFSEDVTAVDVADFVINSTSTASVTNVAMVTASTWDITVSGGDLAGFDGTVGVDLAGAQNITDLVGNALPAGEPSTDEIYTLDNTAPVLNSFTRQNPGAASMGADVLVFRATFSEDVQNVDAADFLVNSSSTATITAVSPVSPNVYDITVSGGDLPNFNGTVGVDLAGGQNIQDLVTNALPAGEPGTDEIYTVVNATDTTPPVLNSFTRRNPLTTPTNVDTLVFRATFSEFVQNVDTADFAVNSTSTATVTGVNQVTADVYDITVSGGDLAGFDGTVGINLAASQNIEDLASNSLPPGEPATDETYLLDNTAPTLTAFSRNNPATSPTNADTLVFDIMFDENVDNVTADDFTITGTTATGVLVGSGSAYTLTVSGGNLAGLNGTVGLDLAGGQDITDPAGNALPTGEPATDETYLLDNTAPVLTSFTRQNPTEENTNAGALVFRASFDEAVQNVGATDFVVNSTSTATIFGVTQVSPDVYDIIVSGGDLDTFSGTVGIDLAAGQDISDPAGNPLPAGEPATDETYLLDNTAPTLTAFERNTPATSPTNVDTLVFDIMFDENVNNVTADDFDITGTSATGVLAGSGSSYTLTVSGGDLAGLDGTVGLDLASGQDITDLASNALPTGEPATDETYILDNTAPTLTAFARNTPAVQLTNADTLVFDITFDEAVTNVTADDFDITGTSATGVLAGSGSAYTLTVSGGDLAGLDGTVGLNLAGGQDISDSVGNPLPASEPATDETYILDNTAPMLTAFARNNPAAQLTNADTLVFDITFDENVTNVTADDFTITGTTATGVLAGSGAAYTLTVSGGDLAGLDGTVGLNLAGGQDISDSVGNPLPASEPATDETYLLDNAAPTPVITSSETSPSNADPVPITITFDEVVAGFSEGDIVVANGMVDAGSLMTTDGGMTYTVTVTPTADGSVTLDVPANVAQDLAGNDNNPANQFSITSDTTAPSTGAIERKNPTDENTNADELTFRVTFSEPVTGVSADDFIVDGSTATVTEVTEESPGVYCVKISGGDLADLNGTVDLDIAPTPTITDAAGNPLPTGDPATDEGYILDNTAPATGSFERKDPTDENTNADELTFRVTFSEPVQNVDASDFAVNGSTAAVTDVTEESPGVYCVKISGGDLDNLDGPVGLDFDPNQDITDLVGNPLPTTEPTVDETYNLDNTAPNTGAIEWKDPLDETTNANELTFRVTFSEPVTGVSADDFTVDGSTAIVTEVTEESPGVYCVNISGGDLANLNGPVDLDIAPSPTITDAVGNPLPTGDPATDEGYILDNTDPVLLSFTRQNPTVENTNAGALVFRASFDEAVQNVGSADFVVNSTSTATIFGVTQVSPDVYDIIVSGGDLDTFSGTVGIDLAGGQDITDLVGNALPTTEPATDETYTLDNIDPTTGSFERKDPTDENTSADELTFRVTFSEPVQNVDASDFAVNGSTATVTDVTEESPGVYCVKISGGDLADLDGRVGLDLDPNQDITDLVGNPLPTAEPTVDQTYNLDNTAPTTGAIERKTPLEENTDADELTFRVTFSEPVSGVSADDFVVDGSTASVTEVIEESPGVYCVKISGGDLADLDGTVDLDIAPSPTITDTVGNPLPTGDPATDEGYIVDNTDPTTGSFERKDPTDENTNADELTFRVTFSEPVANVDASDFAVNGSTATVTDVTEESPGVYCVKIEGGDLAELDGPVGLDLDPNQDITDVAGNPLPIDEPATDETYTLDNIDPTTGSFERKDPTDENTSADELTFRVTFSEPVQNVDASDFAVNGSTATVTDVTEESPGVYCVKISGGDLADLDGPVGLDLDPNQDITDLVGNPLSTAEPTVDEPYNLDNTAPTTGAIERKDPLDENTDADELTFRITFSEPVSGVSEDDFVVDGSTATVTDVTEESPGVYCVKISGGDLADLDGPVDIDIAPNPTITDAAGNPLPTGDPATDEGYIVDNTDPTTGSFERKDPTDENTNADELTFRVTFSEAVANVDASDFAVSGSTATVTDVTEESPGVYCVKISGGDLADLDGPVGLDLDPNQDITDLVGNPLPNSEPTTDETYLLDNTDPTTGSFERKDPLNENTDADELTFRVTFSEPVTNVDASDFAVNGSTATVTDVTEESPGVYCVKISGGDLADLDGPVGLDLAPNLGITDLFGNPLPITEPTTDETYFLDNTAPEAGSFERKDPTEKVTEANELTFRVSFTEDVSGVDASDFVPTGTTATVVDVVEESPGVYCIKIAGGDLSDLNSVVGIDLAPSATIIDGVGNPLVIAEPPIDETYTVGMVVTVTRVQEGSYELLLNEGQTPGGSLVGFAYGFERGTFELPHLGITLDIIPVYSNVGVGCNNSVIGLSPDLEALGVDNVLFQSFEIMPNPRVSNVVEVSTSQAVAAPLAAGEATQTISVSGTQLQNLPALQNPVEHGDVNADGTVAPIDVLLVINTLIAEGPRGVGAPHGAEGEGPSIDPFYYDVNGDSNITAIDALLIINQLNGEEVAKAEGEGAALTQEMPSISAVADAALLAMTEELDQASNQPRDPDWSPVPESADIARHAPVDAQRSQAQTERSSAELRAMLVAEVSETDVLEEGLLDLLSHDWE